MKRRGRFRARVQRCLLSLGMAACSALAQGHDLEYAVKATYLYKFIPFVQWPAGLHAGPSSPWVICISGPDPFGPLLDEAVAGVTIDGRPVVARRLPHTDTRGCHVLFARGSRKTIESQLEQVQNAPVLTVTEEMDAGAISFLTQDDRVRFVVDERYADRQGLRLSSRLLQLSLRVRTISERLR